jgi:hypothetical protein
MDKRLSELRLKLQDLARMNGQMGTAIALITMEIQNMDRERTEPELPGFRPMTEKDFEEEKHDEEE